MKDMSDKKTQSEQGKRKAGNRGTRVALYLTDDLLTAFEAWKGSFEVEPTDSDSVRLFIKEALTKRGYLPLKKDQEQMANGNSEVVQ